MGCMGRLYPENCGIHQLLDAVQHWHNVSALGALGTPCLAIFSDVDPPLLKWEANYIQWAFEVWRLLSCYQEEVLWEGMIQLLKDDTADVVRYLGPAPSVDAIWDKLDSLYGSVSTFDVMIQGFCREYQGRSESIAWYVARLEGKLNESHVNIWIGSLRQKQLGTLGIVCSMALGNTSERQFMKNVW